MCSRRTFAPGWCVLIAVALGAVAPRSAQGRDRSMPRRRPLNPYSAATVETAKDGAARRLENPECARVLGEFRDGAGAPLDRRLATYGMSASEYVRIVPFYDGSFHPRCQAASIILVATPGLLAVHVCAVGSARLTSRLAEVHFNSPVVAEAMVIHEMLHTLGLGENPPSSQEITRQVLRRCR